MSLKKNIRTYLIAGTLSLVPLTITYLILSYLFTILDNLLMPLVVGILILSGMPLQPGDHVPGVGLLATIILILLAGIMARNLLGRKLMGVGERMVQRIPLVGSIYFASKQLVDAFSLPGKKAFREVVMVEYPRKGIFAIGFITGDPISTQWPEMDTLYPVFVPTTPNPTSGMLVMARKEEIRPLSMSVEDGIKLIVSGGILAPRAAAPPDPPESVKTP